MEVGTNAQAHGNDRAGAGRLVDERVVSSVPRRAPGLRHQCLEVAIHKERSQGAIGKVLEAHFYQGSGRTMIFLE